jgi:hypothetical protein
MNLRTILVALAGLVASSAMATILDIKSLEIDFTNPADVAAKASWSSDALDISPKGLGWDGESNVSKAGWFQTLPYALGVSWRPTRSFNVTITLKPAPTEIVLPNGQKTTPSPGSLYVRYSPDQEHWSTWQALPMTKHEGDPQKKDSGISFSGEISVPEVERAPYEKLLAEYARMDVPWKSDEQAAVAWILEKQPDFFARHLPFIGYIEFRHERWFSGVQRIASFSAQIVYGLGGMSSAPKDEKALKDRMMKPWSFKAKAADVPAH